MDADEAARPRRSALYVPAANARAIDKARTLPCDLVILDLEDSVAPEAKAAARDQAVRSIGDGGFGGREMIVRVNGEDTPWAGDDLTAVLGSGADGVLAPKVGHPSTIGRYSERIAAARESGLVALDGVYGDLEDPAGFEAECRQGTEFGFDGKTLIHPSQIDPCNRIYAPSPEEVAWAEAVVAAFVDAGGKGAIRLQGRMVERLHLHDAERLLRLARSLRPDGGP